MILTLQNNVILASCAAIILTLFPVFVQAQGSVALSVSPTLFEMSASENQSWSSAVRVINTNPFPLKVYLNAVNFEPTGESGQGIMIPVSSAESDGSTLAEWFTLPSEEIIIPAEQTVSVSFFVDVPAGAAPGGHFAAIQVGTRSLTETNAPAQVQTSQVVNTLVFLSVAGDIVERGSIRDFTTDSWLNEAPQTIFSIRFENAGNVHLQPQGDITIKNMWGKERGVVPINQTSQFGNVLPDSIRKYNFEWSGEWSFADIGRYTAEVTLAYGDQTRQFVTSETSFWVIPWRTLLALLFVFGGLLWLIVWGVKLYIRKMLLMAGITPELQHNSHKPKRSVSFTAPIGEGILDLRTELVHGEGSIMQRVVYLVQKYKFFLTIVSALLMFVILFAWYLILALTSERGYEVRYEKDGEMVVLPDQIEPTPITGDSTLSSDQPEITVVNRSGIAGLDELRAVDLQSKGYNVTIDRPDSATSEDRTVIVYNPAYADLAVLLQEHFADALLSSFVSEDSSETPITVYLGTDQIE
jgi:hypothetical protein